MSNICVVVTFQVRVTKPIIPASIMRNYEAMEVEKTRLLIAAEASKVVELEAQTEKMKEVIKAEEQAEVSRIKQDQNLAEKQAEQSIERIEDSIRIKRSKAYADAELYQAERLAEADQLVLTDEYLRLLAIQGFAHNTTVVFGDEIPDMALGRGGGGGASLV